MKRVYFIKPVGMDGPIKIGCSQSPNTRRAALASWSPFALEIIAEIDGDHDMERRFHALFAETHQRREWFGWSRRLAATIAAINDGTFDIQALPAPINIIAIPRAGKGARTKEWTPERRFSIAYDMRRRALTRLGMRYTEWTGPAFEACMAARYPDLEARIALCEKAAAEMTEKYGHAGLKPVRWSGPYPQPIAKKRAAA